MKTLVFARYRDGSMARISCESFEQMMDAVKALTNCGMSCIYVERVA